MREERRHHSGRFVLVSWIWVIARCYERGRDAEKMDCELSLASPRLARQNNTSTLRLVYLQGRSNWYRQQTRTSNGRPLLKKHLGIMATQQCFVTRVKSATAALSFTILGPSHQVSDLFSTHRTGQRIAKAPGIQGSRNQVPGGPRRLVSTWVASEGQEQALYTNRQASWLSQHGQATGANLVLVSGG